MLAKKDSSKKIVGLTLTAAASSSVAVTKASELRASSTSAWNEVKATSASLNSKVASATLAKDEPDPSSSHGTHLLYVR